MTTNVARSREDIMAIATPIVEQVPLRLYEGRSLRVGTTRVTLDTVVSAYKGGASPEEIAESFDTLRLADIYAVISYYLRHVDEVEAYIAEGDALAAEEDRILLTHDRQTMPPFAYDRIAAGLAMPGMIVVEQRMSVGRAIDELLMLMDTTPDPLRYDQVHHLSLR